MRLCLLRQVLSVSLVVLSIGCVANNDDNATDNDSTNEPMIAAIGEIRDYSIALGTDSSIYVAGKTSPDYKDGSRKCAAKIENEGELTWQNCPVGEDFGGSVLAVTSNGDAHFGATQCVSWSYIDVEDIWRCEARDVVTTKYATNGQITWQTVAGHDEGLLEDIAIWALVIDDGSRAFAVGVYQWALRGWSYQQDGSLGLISHAVANVALSDVSVDHAGAIRFSGADALETDNGNTEWQAALSCRDETHFAQPVWSVTRDFPTNTILPDSRSVRVTTDDEANSLLMIPLATADDPVEYSCQTTKYDDAGQELWTVEQDDCSASGVAVDEVGAVYLFGNATGEESTECLVVKYDADGVLSWSTVLAPEPATTCDLNAVTFDAGGNVYAVGTHVAELDAQGNENWLLPFANGAAGAVAVDQDGNAYAVGGSEDSPEITVVKYSPSGTELWTAEFDADNP